jgi:hypothetical protein
MDSTTAATQTSDRLSFGGLLIVLTATSLWFVSQSLAYAS